ncbi:acyl-CoA dehydrogenase family protein [Brevibacterium sp. GP-SGM9]|uniref:acyl-CoA dehydrogenase family protein n=1 Tax=unclassified Brevibacterium TaxID=2614124 RepID=UPI001E3C0739|nr:MULTISPECIES: acyl-CoA dehydrogenase family protein [unclassified Brevibacterium]MCD1286141.1 acyl-CoA dehydrogenase [Brevibacterium sp. CCUG 69071]MDK8433498.1 acyl-CoA dehydrogenase family protein [Brevibacterium sp. H-BE7]
MFELSEEQNDFKKSLRTFVDREIIPVAREMEATGEYPSAIVDGLKEMGLFGLTIPEDHDGLGIDPVSFGIVFEELARGWMGIAGVLGSHTMAAKMIAEHGTDDQRATYLSDLASGSRRTALALTEPDAGTDLQGIKTTAKRVEGGYLINGAKMWITNARHADPLPVLVKTDTTTTPAHKGMSILLVEAGTSGFEVTKDIEKLGYKGPESCEIVFENCEVPESALLGGVEGRGMQQVLSALQWGRVNIAGRSVGIAQRALEESVSYAQERESFGQPISEFQAIQLRVGRMATRVQAARQLMYWSAQSLLQGRADGETGMAKVFCSEVALESAIEAMSIHGGYGYSKEYEIERLYRDAPLMSIGEGTNDILNTVIAKSIFSGRTKI